MSNYLTKKAYSLDQEKEYLILEEQNVSPDDVAMTFVVDLSSQSDLTAMVRDFCWECYDKRWHNNKYVLTWVGRKWFEKPVEELTPEEKDKDMVYDIYDRQILSSNSN